MDNTEEYKVQTEDEVKVDEVIQKRGRGRPKTKVEDEGPKEIKKRGPKGEASKHKEYYAQYYRDNYQNTFTSCPSCNKPVQKCRLTRHMIGKFCLNDQISKRYMTNLNQKEDEQLFEKFCAYFNKKIPDLKPELN